MIVKLPRLKKDSRSLFFRLLTSFAVIILLLVSFNFMSYSFFRNNIRDEIIKNNSVNFNSTVTNYETHFKLIKSLLLGLYFNDQVNILRNSSNKMDYYLANQVQKDLQSTLNSANLYFHDVAYYFADIDYVIDKDGSRDAQAMFEKLYHSASYPSSFWKNELQNNISFSLYPAASFTEQTSFVSNALGTLNPIIVKSAANPNFAVTALLDSGRMYNSFHQTNNNSDFYILDNQDSTIFSVINGGLPFDFKPNSQPKGYFQKGANYYFYQKGVESGFTYVNVVPFAQISQQIFHLNLIMLTLLLVSILIGVAVSIFFAVRFHNPLSAIVRSIRQVNMNQAPELSPIKEFNMINEKLYDLFKTNQDIHKDLHAKNSLLQHYAYISKVKMISTNIQDASISIDKNKPFQLLITELFFKERFISEMGMDQKRASYYIKEFIHSLFIVDYPDSLTFQIEKNQILTVLFVNELVQPTLPNILTTIKSILDLDANYCDVTIAASSIYREPLDFNPAYDYSSELLKQRRLGEGVQILTEIEKLPPQPMLHQGEEKEFLANLASGNDAITVPFALKMLGLSSKKQASVQQIYTFALELTNLAIKTLYSMNIPVPHLDDHAPSDKLKECRTLEQFDDFFQRFLTQSAVAIRLKKAETDPITNFVTEYVENNFDGELSLDLLADKLTITSSYLSTYFKEKTGTNFSDYVNTVRMNKAMELLRDSELKIQDIASTIGYYTVASFNRMFKKHSGVTPSEYRRINHPGNH